MLATEQLTDFLSAVADRPGGPAAQHAAVECAARTLDGDVAVLMIAGAVVATVGVRADEVPAHALSEVIAGRRTEIDLDGHTYAVAAARIDGDAAGVLVIGRRGPAAFSPEEITLLRGMTRVLELSLSAVNMLESERRHAAENDRLIDFLHHRQRVFEQLTELQKAIAGGMPLDRLLSGVTVTVRELLGVEMANVAMLDRDDLTRGSLIASSGLPAEVAAKLHGVPVAAAGITGMSVLGNELVSVDDYTTCPIAMQRMSEAQLRSVMATPIHENGQAVGCLTVGMFSTIREWDEPSQDLLRVFAEHISLALTDARTREAMSEAFHDSLTGLASRPLFLSRLEKSIAAGPVTTLFIDLDRFKIVNDSLGHAAGDQLLAGVADRIRACLRDGDTAARLGGDEFAVLLPGTGDATAIARRILETLRVPFQLGAAEAHVSSSIGIARSTDGEHDAQQLMVHADLAMYHAKKQGKDRYAVFETSMQDAFQAGIALEADLRRAVVRHEFELRYQPIVHLQTREITGVEALIRWRHPTRGLVPPMDFIPLAEETGMIIPIGEWVLREACRQVAEWNLRRTDHPLTISVNVSAVQLEQAVLPRTVQSALDDSGLPASLLVLELTESLLVNHRPGTLHRLQAIKALGVRLAIDDFGTGYSSLAYLRRFPIDIIKIDKSFVDDVVDEPTAAALTHGIIQLGRALQLSTIAEGIEHASQLTELAGGDCELGQGYYFAEPLTETDLRDLLFPAPAP